MGISEKTNLVLEIKTQKKFDEVLKQDHITVLDFFSPVCGPCRVSINIIAQTNAFYFFLITNTKDS